MMYASSLRRGGLPAPLATLLKAERVPFVQEGGSCILSYSILDMNQLDRAER